MTPKMKELGEKPFTLTPLHAINRLFTILQVSKNGKKIQQRAFAGGHPPNYYSADWQLIYE